MTPTELSAYLQKIINSSLPLSIMIWGAPGIGKSSIVASVAKDARLEFIDLRLSQLAPTDLRGLPVPIPPSKVTEQGISKWYPPEFLPREGKGILFLDEINMAPPAMQGVAQQLILDRKVGSYIVPQDWFVFAAGNRAEDKAAVFEMPSPLANRFLHLNIEANLECFKLYALERNFAEEIISFLSFRPTLLHKLNKNEPAWPSPRTWEIASKLFQTNLPINGSVGDGAAAEFYAYIEIYKQIPDLEAITKGKGGKINFPTEASGRWATIIGLTARSKKTADVLLVFKWLIVNADEEWIQLYATDVIRQFERRRQLANLSKVLVKDQSIQKYIKRYHQLLQK